MFVYQRVNQHLITHFWTILGGWTSVSTSYFGLSGYHRVPGTPGTTWRFRWLFRWLMSPLRVYPCHSVSIHSLAADFKYVLLSTLSRMIIPMFIFFQAWNMLKPPDIHGAMVLRSATQFSGKEKKVWGKSAPRYRKAGNALSFEFQKTVSLLIVLATCFRT
jgi:hypothetical protein